MLLDVLAAPFLACAVGEESCVLFDILLSSSAHASVGHVQCSLVKDLVDDQTERVQRQPVNRVLEITDRLPCRVHRDRGAHPGR